MKVAFRKVGVGDLKALNRIVNDSRVALHLMVTPPVSMKSTRLLYGQILRERGFWDAVLVDGMIAGSATLRRMPEEKNAHAADFGIALAEEYWGMGIGGITIDYMIRRARAAGIKRVQLTVASDNCRALALYRRHGFKMEGNLRRAYKVGGKYRDAILMARLLA
ncbi:MAG: GNAT family protein [Candidatus Altiarchaeota archaeon]